MDLRTKISHLSGSPSSLSPPLPRRDFYFPSLQLVPVASLLLLCTMEKSLLAQALKPTYLASENKIYTSLSLPFFKLNKLSSLSLFPYILCCVTQYSRYHFTSAKQRRIMITFNVLAVPLLMQPSMGLAFKY